MRKSLLFVFILIGFTTISCRTKTDQEVNEIISKSRVLERVDRFCTDLPKPVDFIYDNKQISGNSNTRALVFNYLSDKKPTDIKSFFIDWANENGWTVVQDNEYIKGNQTVVINFENFFTSNVNIYCGEKVK